MKIYSVCWICGKKFGVAIDKNRKIKTDCYYSNIPKNIFLGWTYEPISFNPYKTKIHFKNSFWKILAYTKIQREVIYFIWKIVFGGETLEYWECTKCCKE